MSTEIPGYAIKRELGKGGMGMVYLAERERDGLPVALKVLPPNLLTPTTARRFQREGRSLKVLDHPHIVRVHEVGARDGHHFIAMEYVKGRPMSRAIAENPQGLALAEVLRIGTQIADALALLHSRGMIHRDLKPGNIMITDQGDSRLLDFGLVQVDGLTMLTATGNIVGTPTYMSPEQCAGHPVDHRSDIYSYGILLFELVTGRPPFRSESVYEVLDQQRTVPAPAPTEFRPDVPLELEQIILRCLEKERQNRPQNMDEVLAALEASPSPRPGALPAAGAELPTSLLRATVIVTLLGLLAVGAWLLSSLPHAEAARSTLRDRWHSWLESVREPQDLRSTVQKKYRALSRAQALFDMGQRNEQQGRLQPAYRFYRQAVEAFESKPEFLEALLRVGEHLGQREETMRWIRSHLRKRNLDPDAVLERSESTEE